MHLAHCYEDGIGCLVDEGKAFYWYKKSAEQENSFGQWRLAHCYEDGIGCCVDKEKAFYWYKKSAEQGNSFAIDRLKESGIE